MRRITLIFCILIKITIIFPETMNLTLVSFKSGNHEYFYELLRESLKLEGIDLKIDSISDLSQSRIFSYIDQGKLDLHWFIESEDRNKNYRLIDVGLTNGLIGKRILFIPKNSQSEYNGISSLEEFRNLNKIGGFGLNWFDTNIWKLNNLPYWEQIGYWETLFKMVGYGGRGIDYFSRGLIEILNEYDKHQEYLDIEKNLILSYKKDFKFYTKKDSGDKIIIIERALNRAYDSGLMDSLVRKYWKNDFESLDIDNRIEIHLESPE